MIKLNSIFRPYKLIAVQLFFYGLVTILPAQTPLIQVDARVDKAVVTVGDLIHCTLTIDRARDLEIRDPVRGEKIGLFEVKQFRILPPAQRGDRIVERFEYTLAVYDTGTYYIPPYPVAFLPSDTASTYQIVSTEPLEIIVQSVLAGEDSELRDIRPPMGLPGVRWWLWALLGGGLLLAAATGYWWWRKKKAAGGLIFRKEVIRPAHEIALEELDQLLQSDLLARQQYKAFYSILSDILRRYIEGRFFIRALEETTEELAASLRTADIPEPQTTIAIGALRDCDLVKFARYVPVATETEATVERVRNFIEQTRLEFEAVEHVQKVPEDEKISG